MKSHPTTHRPESGLRTPRDFTGWMAARATASLAGSACSATTVFAYDGGAMADDVQIPLSEQLEGIGAQLDWVRGYL